MNLSEHKPLKQYLF